MPIAIAAGRTVSASGTRDRQTEHRADAATHHAREHLRERDAVDPPLDHADGAFEEPAEDAAGQVADEAAEHPADPGELGAVGREVLAEHEAGRGEQHHGEQSRDLDEH